MPVEFEGIANFSGIIGIFAAASTNPVNFFLFYFNSSIILSSTTISNSAGCFSGEFNRGLTFSASFLKSSQTSYNSFGGTRFL